MYVSNAVKRPCWNSVATIGSASSSSATPNTPSGNSRKRVDSENQLCEPVTSSDRITVSSSRFTCITDEPNRVGTISRRIRRTCGCPQSQRGHTSSPSLCRAGSRNTSCSTPASSTAQPKAMIGTCSSGASHSAPAIMHRLRMTGASAGNAKRWKLFSAPEASAVSETNSRNGKVSRSKSIVRSNLCGWSSAPGSNTVASCGAKISPSAVTTSSTPPRVPATRDISRRRSSCVPVSLTSVNTGTNAVVNDPSANSLRMKVPLADIPTTCHAGECTTPTKVFSSNVGLPSEDHAQLMEYTFGDAITANGAPYPMHLSNVGYNISSVDQVYLPVAM